MKFKVRSLCAVALVVVMTAVAFVGCSSEATTKGDKASMETPTESMKELSGEIKIDGSSTVFPITEAVAEEFRYVHPKVKIPVGVSGTGGGFKKFTARETDISDASRPIKDKEKALAEENNLEYIELTVAYDGLSIVVNGANDFVESLTVEQLQEIWGPDSTVKTWADVNPEWPAEDIKFYAPGTDSGTFDYFTDEINGESGAIRPDFIASEDDNILVQGVAGDKYAIGFFGYAYYEENKDKLKIVKVDGGKGPIEPTFETIKSGEYSPLSRPLFIYVAKESLAKEEVKTFVEFYIANAAELSSQVGYVALPQEMYDEAMKLIQE